MTDRELMQQALYALEYASDMTKPENMSGCGCPICVTIAALNERLAQPEQEPVAWRYDLKKGGSFAGVSTEYSRVKLSIGENWQPFYTTPPQRKPLTYPQIHEFDWPDGVSFEDILLFVRAIEEAHGIKKKNT